MRAPPCALALVAGLDRAPQHALRPLVEMTRERDADARGHLGDAGDTTDGCATPIAMRSASPCGGLAVRDVTAHEHEPLAVHVRDDVTWPGHRAEALRDRFEEVPTRGVAEAFLDEARGCRAPPTRWRAGRG